MLDLLTAERNSALTEATRLRNQIRALLVQLDPQYQDLHPSQFGYCMYPEELFVADRRAGFQ